MSTYEGISRILLQDHEPNEPLESQDDSKPIGMQNNAVSTLHKCPSKNAMKLCIYDIAYKLKHCNDYDIGGTNTDGEPDLWFYYTTSICPGYNYLLNLFVCHRKTGNFAISVSSSNELTHRKLSDDITGWSTLSSSHTRFTFKSAQPNENFYLKTFCFTEKDLKELENHTLFIPILIEINTKHTFNTDIIKRIKLSHDFGDLLSKQEKTDFVLESASHKQFPVHKIILAAHSSVLRNMMKNTKENCMFIDISDNDMELLLQFIYTGTVKDIFKQDCLKLLKIADKFQLKNLFLLTQFAINEQINVRNAIEIALISEKYNLHGLQFTVFNFIKDNPAVIETDGWKNLKDIDLAKKLFQFLYKSRD